MHYIINQDHLQTDTLDEHWPLVPPSTPNLLQDVPQYSTLFELDDLASTHYNSALPTNFPPFSGTTLTENGPSPFATNSGREIAMLDLPFDTVTTDSTDVFSSYVPTLPGLGSIPTSAEKQTDLPVAEDRNCLTSGGCCFAFASRAVKHLHVPSSLCLSTVQPEDSSSRAKQLAPRTADSVLIANSEAILAMMKILRCSCSLKPQLQMLLATICDKLIAWYYAVACGKERFDLNSTPTTPDPKWHVDSTRKERVLRRSVNIGEYCLEDAAGVQIIARVVMSHLQKLEYLIVLLSKRIKSSNTNSTRQNVDHHSSFHSDPKAVFGIFSQSLTAYLTGQSQAAQKELERLIGS
ncbi:hypothetical protein LTR84_008136 [Exophiala bonariae]|uniref:Aflatoxin regulatory protein domain-containing protein n=1 Tax=Exophiala bonariae TaxID=1690606 RepID=A0AAV9NPG9_9EURO|nr:hypothetical protein LTR84_008136 [Exophiala bonariae]